MELNIPLIQESFAAVKPHLSEVIVYFYKELFKKYPAAKELFRKNDLAKQRLALSNGLSHIIEYLGDDAHLADYLVKIGVKHQCLAVRPEHYNWVSDSLLQTLGYYLGKYWTDELKTQWTRLCAICIENLREGLRPVPVSIMPKTMKPESSVQKMVKSLAKDLFKNALELETEETFLHLARERARELLTQAIELEVKELFAAAFDEKKTEKDVGV